MAVLIPGYECFQAKGTAIERALRQIVTGLLEERCGGHCALRELGSAAECVRIVEELAGQSEEVGCQAEGAGK